MRVLQSLLLAVVGFLSMDSTAPAAAQPQERPARAEAVSIACRAMEVHTNLNLAMTIVMFHQRDKADAERLGVLLRRSSGETVEFQADEGSPWRRATVFRLKSCFGRGLLLVPAGGAQLKEGDEFLLKFPSD